MLKGMIGAMAMVLSLNATATMAAENWPWTTAGSTGTVDESNTSVVVLSSGSASLASNVAMGTSATIRYDVIGTEGLYKGADISLTVRYKDAGATEQVRASLKRYDMNTGSTTTLVTFDSNTRTQSSLVQKAVVTSNVVCFQPGPGFDFDNNIYYVEVTLTRNNAIVLTPPTGSPVLYGISVVGFTQLC